MKQKWIDWFKHVQKCGFNHRCPTKNLYDYARESIMLAHADLVRSFFGRHENKLLYTLPCEIEFPVGFHTFLDCTLSLEGVLYTIKQDYRIKGIWISSPNIINECFDPSFRYDIVRVLKMFAAEWKKDKEIIDNLSIYGNATLPQIIDDEMEIKFRADYHSWDYNRLDCKCGNTEYRIDLPRSLFYQETPESEVMVCDINKLKQLLRAIDKLSRTFTFGRIYNLSRTENALKAKVCATASVVDGIIEYGRKYLKNWARYEVYNCGDSVIVLLPSSKLMVEIDEGITYDDLADNWRLLQDTIKHPYFEYVHF